MTLIEALTPIAVTKASPAATVRQQRFFYRVSGLTMVSDLRLPSAIESEPPAAEPEISVLSASVPRHLPHALRQGTDWETASDTFLLRMEGVGRFLIAGGSSVRYQVDRGYRGGDLPLYLLGTCLAVLLQQRGSMVLHASAVAVGERAMLFCGPSGAGKSTLAAMLCQQGYAMLSDDTCRLDCECGRFTVCTDGRMFKLWQNSLFRLELEGQRGPAVRQQADKFYLAPPRTESLARPLSAVFVLESCTGKPPALERMTRVEAMTALRDNAYRTALVQAMNLEPSYFAACAAMLGQTPVFRLRRPMDFAYAPEVVDLLERHWSAGAELVH